MSWFFEPSRSAAGSMTGASTVASSSRCASTGAAGADGACVNDANDVAKPRRQRGGSALPDPVDFVDGALLPVHLDFRERKGDQDRTRMRVRSAVRPASAVGAATVRQGTAALPPPR